MLIINQRNFYFDSDPKLSKLLPDKILSERKGTDKDVSALKNLFKTFQYTVSEETNLTHLQILRKVEDVVRESSQHDGLIILILSHGYEGLVYGSNSIPVQIKDVKEKMSNPVLLHKPKILIIQACQGHVMQETVKRIKELEFDSPSPSQPQSDESGSVRADFLLFCATIEGFASIRDPENGTWFIQDLVKKIYELRNSQHFMDICTAVIDEVSSKRYRSECMVPELKSSLKKLFNFPSVEEKT